MDAHEPPRKVYSVILFNDNVCSRWHEFLDREVTLPRHPQSDLWVFYHLEVGSQDIGDLILSDWACMAIRAIPSNFGETRVSRSKDHLLRDVVGLSTAKEFQRQRDGANKYQRMLTTKHDLQELP